MFDDIMTSREECDVPPEGVTQKMYLNMNVYEALQARLAYIFSEFDNIYVAFSGGKDSGVLLNLVVQYMKAHGITRRIGLFHQDFEAQYQKTTEYVTRTFAAHADYIEPFWICLPLASKTALSNYEMYWYPWDDETPELWVRPMPSHPYVYNLKRHPFDFYQYKMPQEEMYRRFGAWFGRHRGGGKTVGLLGLRAEESLNRYRGIFNTQYQVESIKWITKEQQSVCTASPLYDWTTKDVWVANGKFKFDYNRLYDLFYKAGQPISQMRVASPFNEWAAASLHLYRVIEPETWARLVGRVGGVNFGAIYGRTKAMGYREITLPPGHTWKTYTAFLLSSLPARVRNMYLEKFKTSMDFWAKTGGGFSDEVIREIEACGYHIRRNGVSYFTKDHKPKIVFVGEIPDHTDDVKSTIHIPSWKRMCFCIVKNDHLCRFMGFSPTKEQQRRIDAIRGKYKNLTKGLM